MAIVTSPSGQVVTPHFAFPFQIGSDGTFQVVEQDSIEEITGCVQVLIGTELGSREELPEYGIVDPTFANQVDMNEIERVINDWEDRAAVNITDTISSSNELVQNVMIATGLS